MIENSGGASIPGKSYSLIDIIRMNAVFYIALFILLMSTAGIYLYRHQKEKVDEGMLRVCRETEGSLRNEMELAEDNLHELKGLAEMLEVFPKNERGLKLLEDFIAEHLGEHRIEYNAYLAFEPQLSRKYFGSEATVIAIHRDYRLMGDPSYLDPRTFISAIYTDPEYQKSPTEIWYHIAKRSHKIEFTDVYFDERYMKKWMITMGLGIYSETGEFRGMAGIDILLDELAKFVDGVRLDDTGGVLIVDRVSNRVLAQPEGTSRNFIQTQARYSQPQMSPDRWSQWKQILNNEGKIQSFTGENGKSYLVSSRRVNGLSWSVVSFREYNETYSFVFWQISLLFTIGVGGLGLLIWLSQRFRLSATVPLMKLISSLNENIQAVTQNQRMKVEVTASGYLEVKTVSQLVNQLAKAVNTRMTEQMRLVEEERGKSFHASRMASIGRLAGNVAHEINNPLAALSLNAEVLEDNLEKPEFSKPLALERVRSIRRLVNRIAQTVKGFLALSREGNSIPLAHTPLKEIIQDTLNVCQSKIQASGVDLVVGPMPAVSLYCRGVQISQVLLNLIVNAFDAVQSLPEKWIQLKFREADRMVIIEVIDSGRGIPKDVVEHMMEPFYTTKEVNRGTGLGLSISKSIIEEHRGRLYYAPDSPQTTFIVELPKT